MLRGGCCGILSSLHVLGLSMETCKAKKIQLQDVVIVVVFLKKKKKKSGNAEKQSPTYLSQIVYTEFL